MLRRAANARPFPNAGDAARPPGAGHSGENERHSAEKRQDSREVQYECEFISVHAASLSAPAAERQVGRGGMIPRRG